MNRFFILLSLLFVLFCNDLAAKKYTRQSDSLELVKFYQQTGGDNWTKNNGWRDGSLPVWKWFGILSDEVIKGSDTMVIVTDIELGDNNLTGSLPELVLPDLFGLFVNSNKLSGLIPAYKNGKFAWMDVSKNKFMIEDFMPNIDFFLSLESFVYEAQDSSFKITVTYNANSIFFDHPYKCNNCTYHWYINGVREYKKSKDTMSHNLFFAKYKVDVLHTKLPLLKYKSNEFQILPEAISPADSAKDIDKPVLNWKEIEVADKYYIFSTFKSAGSEIERYDSSYQTTFSYPEDVDLSNMTVVWSVGPVRGNEVGTFTKARSFTTKFLSEYTDPSDSLELVRFYNNSGGENWTKKTNWLSDKPVWQWYGVSTKSARVGDKFVHRVIKLDVSLNKVSINEIDIDFPYLEELNLGFNNSVVKFNEEKVNLPNLKKINLRENDIQDDISKLNKLKFLEEITINKTKLKSIDGLKLDSLKSIYAAQNEISGLQNIDCPKLTIIDVSNNSISNFGNIEIIENLNFLAVLNLSSNKINDSIANIKSKSITTLNLSRNSLIGNIDLKNLPKLSELNLSYNNYSDIIEVINVSELKILDLSYNEIVDIIDNNNLHYLEKLYLTENNLTKFNNISLPNIKNLYLGNNKISGELQDFAALYPTLKDGFLMVNANLLTFEDLKTNFIENKKIKFFGYTLQNITYKYMAERVGTEYHLEPIYEGIGDRFEWISNNKVVSTDRVFVVDKPFSSYQCKISYSKIPDLYYYTDSFNPLPAKIYPAKNAEKVELRPTFRWSKLDYATKYRITISQDSSMYSGSYYETSDTSFTIDNYLIPNRTYYWTIATWVDDKMSNINISPWKFKTIDGNIILNKKDSLALVDLYNKTNGKNWKNQNNWLTDSAITKWTGVSLTISENDGNFQYFVRSISLIDNNLVGEIDRIDLDSLDMIYLQNNKLTGKIPEFSSEKIRIIYLSGNQFENGIENTFKNSVFDVFIDNNNLSQELPDIWGDKLQYLVLNRNKIRGAFPELNAPKLINLNLDSNEIESLPTDISHDAIRYITISNNKISGEIPNFEAKLLETLKMNRNNLSGEIPILNLPSLTRLELNNNKLSGEIPTMKTPRLSFLDLSYNKLSGKTPNKFSSMSNTLNISYNKFSFEDISYSYNDYFSIYYYYYPQDTLFELIPIKDGSNYYLEVKTEDNIQKSYTWFRNDTLIQGVSNKIANITDLDAVYHCRVGYKTLDKLFISTVKSSYNSLTSVEDGLSSGDVIISPNPASEYITINLERCATLLKCGTSEIEIYDVMGIKIQSTPVETQNFVSLQKINVSHLVPGVYFVKIGGMVTKFVKM